MSFAFKRHHTKFLTLTLYKRSRIHLFFLDKVYNEVLSKVFALSLHCLLLIDAVKIALEWTLCSRRVFLWLTAVLTDFLVCKIDVSSLAKKRSTLLGQFSQFGFFPSLYRKGVSLLGKLVANWQFDGTIIRQPASSFLALNCVAHESRRACLAQRHFACNYGN